MPDLPAVTSNRQLVLRCALKLQCVVVMSIGLSSALPAFAWQQAAGPITQRSINEMAAALEAARRSLLDDAGLRQPHEDLTAYLRRLALPLPGETPTRYKTRVQRYLDLFDQSMTATRAGRRLPALRDTSAPNRNQWERAVRALRILPARVRYTQNAWQRATGNASNNLQAALKTAKFDAELAQTASVIITGGDGLRDARP